MAEHDLNEIWNSFNYGQILKAYEAYERFSKAQDNSDHQGVRISPLSCNTLVF